MKKRSPLLMGLAALACWALVIPPDVLAQAAQNGQRAGAVARMIPQVRIVRGAQQILGAPNALVDWGDLITTQRDGRARIALDDGSLLNVGSESSLKVTQYDPGAQQSEMDLAYGKLRAKVAKITQPNGKFEVHTPVGVAGVVGTDFYLSYQTENRVLQLIVYEGTVRFCNLAGMCVLVGGGLVSTIRGNNQPDPPSQVTSAELSESGEDTEVVGPAVGVVGVAPHLGIWTIVGLSLLVIVPAVVLPITLPHHTLPPPSPLGQFSGVG
jgi:ferric-dicitrate binding protein FerR (iron transport regulator)